MPVSDFKAILARAAGEGAKRVLAEIAAIL